MERLEGLQLKVQKMTSPTAYWQISTVGCANANNDMVYVIPEQQPGGCEDASFTMRYPGKESRTNPSKHLRDSTIAGCIFRSSDGAAPKAEGDRRPKHDMVKMKKSRAGRYCWAMDFRLSKDKPGFPATVKRWIRGKGDTAPEFLYWGPGSSGPDEWKLFPGEGIGNIFGGYHHYKKDIGAEFRGCILTIDGDLAKDKGFVRRACLTLVAVLWVDEQSGGSTRTE